MKHLRAALLTPPYRNYRIGESLGIRYLASYLRGSGHECDVFDAALLGFSVEELCAAVLNRKYSIVGISIEFSVLFRTAAAIGRRLKAERPDLHITLGGHFPTFEYSDLLASEDWIDSIARFEGEQTFLELIRSIEQGKSWKDLPGLAARDAACGTANPIRKPIENLDSLPFPFREDLAPHRPVLVSAITSRGCLLNCTFCSVPAFFRGQAGPAWRYRAPESVVRELRHIKEDLGCRAVSFVDDNFIGSNVIGRRRAIALAEAFQKDSLGLYWNIECRTPDASREILEPMVQGGLRQVNLGIEAADPDLLAKFAKNATLRQNEMALRTVRDLDLDVNCHVIMFTPYSSWDSMASTARFLQLHGVATYSNLTGRLFPYKGTREYLRLQEQGFLISVGPYHQDWVHPDPTLDQFYGLIDAGLSPYSQLFDLLDARLFEVSTIDACPSRRSELDSLRRILVRASNSLSELFLIQLADQRQKRLTSAESLKAKEHLVREARRRVAALRRSLPDTVSSRHRRPAHIDSRVTIC